jgi:hypothetical protein
MMEYVVILAESKNITCLKTAKMLGHLGMIPESSSHHSSDVVT